MRNLLVAFDGSECSFAAVEYVARQFSGMADIKVILFYVLPNLPPYFWDDGHILNENERQERDRVVKKWLDQQAQKMNPLFGNARDMLARAGFSADQVEAKTKSDFTDVPGSIIEEARTGPYLTLVLGRCGSRRKEGGITTGSVTSSILARGEGLSICVTG